MKDYKFPEVLAELMEKNNINQTQLGKEVNISQFAISKWVNFKSTPSIFSLMGLSQFFNVSVDYLIYGDSSK